MLYSTISQAFTKTFFSIKGIYYRVEIMGTAITWIQPYKFNQRLPFDIDYKVMGTFLEFYQSLLKFVNYKLFSDIGVQYPLEPSQVPTSTSFPQFLDCAKVKKMQAHVTNLMSASRDEDHQIIDKAFKESPEMQRLNQRGEQAKK